MKTAIATLALLATFLAAPSMAQTTPPSPFADTTYSFGLTPITLPGASQTLAGAETDILINVTPNNAFGQSTLISTSPFIGGRYDRTIPQVGKWLQEHTALTGFNFQAYVTGSLGIVKAERTHWGERAGLGLRWAPNGATNFSVAFEAQANNLPGISRWIPSISVSPQFRF
jgi:hypothetical protein